VRAAGLERNKLYPDFVFARVTNDGQQKLVVLETKGLHLAGNNDTSSKQKLLGRLSEVFADESRPAALGGLDLVGPV
jgi:type III restriction enzyme